MKSFRATGPFEDAMPRRYGADAISALGADSRPGLERNLCGRSLPLASGEFCDILALKNGIAKDEEPTHERVELAPREVKQ